MNRKKKPIYRQMATRFVICSTDVLFFVSLFKVGFLINELRVTNDELRGFFYIGVTSYYLLHELRVHFYVRVPTYYLLHVQLNLSHEL